MAFFLELLCALTLQAQKSRRSEDNDPTPWIQSRIEWNVESVAFSSSSFPKIPNACFWLLMDTQFLLSIKN